MSLQGNGQPLFPTSTVTPSRPEFSIPPKARNRLRLASGTVFLVAVLNIVLGSLLTFWQDPSLTSPGWSIVVIILGAIFLLLGFFVARRSAVALGIAVALYALDALVLLFQGQLSGVAMHLALLACMVQGFRGIREIRNAEGTSHF